MIYRYEVIEALSNMVELINSGLAYHSIRTAYIAKLIGQKLGISGERLSLLAVSALLHDIGTVYLSTEKLNRLLEFEYSNCHEHSVVGYHILKNHFCDLKVSEIVLYHHLSWNHGEGEMFKGKQVPIESHIIQLADRIEILIKNDEYIVDQKEFIYESIKFKRGEMFNPHLVDIFLELAQTESFWLDLIYLVPKIKIKELIGRKPIKLSMDGLFSFARLIGNVVDFRSQFTATHSTGVAYVSYVLSKLCGMDDSKAELLKLAGFFHDIGKLAISNEILDKPDKLNEKEFNIIKSHSYHTKEILDNIPKLKKIGEWASNHHEKLNGSGYPNKFSGRELTTESRIVAIADIFTALLEKRPYRPIEMARENVVKIMSNMANDNMIDKNIVTILLNNFEKVNLVRKKFQEKHLTNYYKFKGDIELTLENMA